MGLFDDFVKFKYVFLVGNKMSCGSSIDNLVAIYIYSALKFKSHI